MSRTYVDITQLAHLSGAMTGIPRVMHELVIRFGQTDPDARFVVWVKELQALCEVDLEKTLAHRGYEIAYLREGEEAPTFRATRSEQPEALLIPTPAQRSLKKLAVRAAKKGLAQTAHVSPQLAKRLQAKAQHARMHSYKRVSFHKRDILFIPWGEWWDPNFTDCLVRHHKHDGVRLVQIIHDMGPTVQPQFFEPIDVDPAIYNAKIVPIADLVLVVSNNTKQELTGWLRQQKLHTPPIKVFRLGDDIYVGHASKPTNPAFFGSKLKGNDFILFVGTIELKKNHLLLYYVYKLAKARGISLPKVVMAGRRGWLTEATFALMTKDAEVSDSFVFQIHPPDEELLWLYNNCLFTVQTSLYEGWGIPIAESVSRGVPCLCGDFGSMSEVAEGYVEHFCPASTDECLAGIQRWLNPRDLKKARERVSQYKPHSWDDAYNQVRAYLKEMK